MSTTGDVSLYFHIPFCTSKCPYCHFYVIPNKEHHKKLYLEALYLEWKQKLPLLRDQALRSIYLGGGTPSVFPEAIETILSWTKNIRGKDLEITCEVNPEDASSSLINSLDKWGINRISLGIQSFDQKDLISIGRTSSDASLIFKIAEKIPNISIDLMYDIPGQTPQSFERSLQKAVQMPITHLSLYNLTIEPHTLFYKIKPKQPEEKESLTMLQSAVQILEAHGFSRYEISAFRKPGYASRHNTRYWRARPFLGFGPSAFSYWKQKRFQNKSHLLRYHRALKEGNSPVDFEEELSWEKRQNERLAIELRILEGVFMPDFEQRNGKLHPELRQNLSQLIQDGFLEKRQNLRLTEKGKLFYDSAMSVLI